MINETQGVQLVLQMSLLVPNVNQATSCQVLLVSKLVLLENMEMLLQTLLTQFV